MIQFLGITKKVREYTSPIREKNTNKLTVIKSTISSISKEPTSKKICKEKSIKNHDHYEDSDVLSDEISSMSYKDLKNKKRHLFTNKTFLQSTPKSDRSPT